MAFAAVKGLTNQEILYSVENGSKPTSLFSTRKNADTTQFASDLSALASQTDPSFAQKGLRTAFRSLDDNLKVHDLGIDEVPYKETNVQLGWDLEDAMTSQVSNNEVLGDVYLPAIEMYEAQYKPV